jgi:hypothetical protein
MKALADLLQAFIEACAYGELCQAFDNEAAGQITLAMTAHAICNSPETLLRAV